MEKEKKKKINQLTNQPEKYQGPAENNIRWDDRRWLRMTEGLSQGYGRRPSKQWGQRVQRLQGKKNFEVSTKAYGCWVY